MMKLKIIFFIFCFSFIHISFSILSKNFAVAEENNNLDDLIPEGEDSQELIDIESAKDVDIEDFEDIEEPNNQEQQKEENFSQSLQEEQEPVKDDKEYEVIDDSDLEREFITDKDIESDFNTDSSFEDSSNVFEEENLEKPSKEKLDINSKESNNEENIKSEEQGSDDLDFEEISEEEDFEKEESDSKEESSDSDLVEEDLDTEEINWDDNKGDKKEQKKTTKDKEDSFLEKDFLEDDNTSEAEDINIIRNIRYVAEKNQVIVDASQMILYQSSQNKKNRQVIIEIMQAKLSKHVKWPYILRDFNTNFGLIQADQKTLNTVRLLIQLKKGDYFPSISHGDSTGQNLVIAYSKGGFDSKSSQQEGVSSIHEDLKNDKLLSAKKLEDIYLGHTDFSGQPISFHVIDAPIKQVLRFISEESNLNLVIGDGVDGNLTLKLESVPWDQALHTIFQVKSLGYIREGNIITILPLLDIERRQKKLAEIVEQQRAIEPSITKNISLNYEKADNIKSKIQELLRGASSSSGQGGGSASQGSGASQAQIISHVESNTLIVTATKAEIEKIEKVIQFLDKAPKQVVVEAKIIEASENFAKNFGLDWSLNQNLPVSINPIGFVEFIQGKGYSGSVLWDKGSASNGLFQLNGIPFIGDIQANLNIAEGEGYAKVISTPKVVVLSGKQASITRNSPILIPTSTTTTTEGDVTESNETSDVQISLQVTPTVTSTGGIFLEVSISRDDPGGAGGAFKVSRQAKTEVLIENGQTIVIGGIYEEDESSKENGIPFLKKIPFLNFFANNKSNSSSKAELLIFLTPKVLEN